MAAAKPPGTSGNPNGYDIGQRNRQPRLLERLFGLHRLIDDEAQDAEIGGVRDGQGADVDAGLREDGGDFRETPRLVFYKN